LYETNYIDNNFAKQGVKIIYDLDITHVVLYLVLDVAVNLENHSFIVLDICSCRILHIFVCMLQLIYINIDSLNLATGTRAVNRLKAYFSSITFSHIFCESNCMADCMAKQRVQRSSDFVAWL
jgi:hypothetical protein